MASQLLEKIINDTTLKFGGRESLVAQASNVTYLSSLNDSGSLPPSDQLDGLSSMMQDIEMGQKERLFWILLFSLMVLVAAGGNIVVIHIVSINKEMKSVTNYFLVNLSLADTMVSTLNVIFNFISMLNSHWPFGNIYCKISNFIAILSISASVFTLTAISCDRYNAIIHPLRPRMSHRHAIGWILLIWTLSSALALPNLIYSVVVEDRLVNENLALTCTMIWPDGRYPLSSYDHIYNIIILVVTYLVPILTMAILYYRVGKELWGHQAIGEDVEKQARAVLAKKKIVKMMIVVVIIFALCWLPYHGFFVVNYYLPTIFQDGPLYYQRCYLIMYWLAMSNSMYNPIIIYFMNSKFRHEFKRVIYIVCCCRSYVPPPIKNETSANQNHSVGSGFRLGSKGNQAGRQRQNGNGESPNGALATATRMPSSANSHAALRQSSSKSNSSNLLSANQHQRQQHPFNSSIEVIITHSDELDDGQHSTSLQSNREREPFIVDASGGAAEAGRNNRSNSHDKDDNNNNYEASDNFKTDLESERILVQTLPSAVRPNGGRAGERSNRNTGKDKVWI